MHQGLDGHAMYTDRLFIKLINVSLSPINLSLPCPGKYTPFGCRGVEHYWWSSIQVFINWTYILQTDVPLCGRSGSQNVLKHFIYIRSLCRSKRLTSHASRIWACSYEIFPAAATVSISTIVQESCGRKERSHQCRAGSYNVQQVQTDSLSNSSSTGTEKTKSHVKYGVKQVFIVISASYTVLREIKQRSSGHTVQHKDPKQNQNRTPQEYKSANRIGRQRGCRIIYNTQCSRQEQ